MPSAVIKVSKGFLKNMPEQQKISNGVKTTAINIKGTHCNSCKILIEDVCKEIKGATSCSVNFETGETKIEHDESFDWKAFKKEIEALGNYKVEINQ